MRLRNFTLAGILALTACNATPAQVGGTIIDGLALAGCLIPQILSGVTAVATLLTCANATEALIVDAIDDFTAQKVQPDGGLASAAQLQGVTAQGYANLATARANAVAALAAKASSK